MPESRECREVREVLPELALGVASGDERARALAHVAGCADCRRELEEVAGIADDLLLLAPEQEPPAGFDAAVLARIEPRRQTHRLRTGFVLAAAAAVIAAVAVGVTWWQGSDERDVAAEYREVLAVADGKYLRAAPLTSDGRDAGKVFAYEGQPSWLFLTVDNAVSGTYHVRLVTNDGQSVWVGTCPVEDGSGAWGTTIDVPIQDVDRIEMYGTGLPTMVSELPS